MSRLLNPSPPHSPLRVAGWFVEEVHVCASGSHALLPAIAHGASAQVTSAHCASAHGAGLRPSLVPLRVLAVVVVVLVVAPVCVVVTAVGRFVPGVGAVLCMCEVVGWCDGVL